MSNDRSNELLVSLRHAEMLREAERFRLAAKARPARPNQSHIRLSAQRFRPVLAWFGRGLIGAGRRLLEQADGTMTS